MSPEGAGQRRGIQVRRAGREHPVKRVLFGGGKKKPTCTGRTVVYLVDLQHQSMASNKI